MKQTILIGSLLVVPLAAWLLWVTADADRAKDNKPRTSVPQTAPIDSETLEPEQADFAPTSEERPVSQDADVPGALEQVSASEILDEETDPVEESRRIRLPVIQAIRGKHPTPEGRREAMLDALRQSGPSYEEWTKQSTAVFDDWTRGISSDVGLRANWNSAQCFQAGCEVEVSFPDRDGYERASKEFRSLREEDASHGGRIQTPAVDDENGQVRASWIMLRPDGSRS